jgi:CRISPR-associated endonuclease/helicase Cas3
VEDCLELFNVVRRFKQSIAVHVADRAHVEVEKLWDSAFLTVILHDIGKASTPFQEYIRNEGRMESHAFLSFYFANQICSRESKLRLDGQAAGVEALAIASHHSPLHPSKFKTMYEGKNEDPQVLKDVVTHYLARFASRTTMQYMGRSLEWDASFPSTYDDIYQSFALLNARLRRSPGTNDDSTRLPFAFLKGILHYCDWYGSGKEFNPQYSPTNIERRVFEYLRGKQWKPVKLNMFQENSKLVHDALLRAPTGTGKTEAALIWADKYAGSHKVLYLLPTMTTSNKMYDRLKETLGCEVGLLHGTSDYMLKTNEEYEGQEEFEHVKRALFCKSFMYPCTVATIDQLLFTMFNWGRWELKLLNAGNSAIIVDEIHAYEPYTVALIIHTLRLLSILGAKKFVMSATIPIVLRDFLQNELGLAPVPGDASYDDRVRVSIRLKTSEEITSAVPEIIKCYRNGKKVLVICNTVATSKTLFQKVKGDNRVKKNESALLHSQFIMKDRADKENTLDDLMKKKYGGPYILVATQVVEVSLDIDFDILFTEACPIDALIQRLGRVNRYGNRPPAEVSVYKQSTIADKVYDPALVVESLEQLQTMGRLPREADLGDAVNKTYEKTNYGDLLRRELGKTRGLIADVQENLRYVYRLTVDEKKLKQVVTRESDYITLNVIPRSFADEALALPKNERYRRIGFTVKVPYYKIKQNLRDPIDGVLIADVDYDPQLGVVYAERQTEAYIF